MPSARAQEADAASGALAQMQVEAQKERARAEARSPVEYLVIAYSLDEAEANARLERQFHAQQLSDALTTEAADVYGGMWIDQVNGGRIKVALVGESEAATSHIEASPIRNWVDVVPAERTLRTLTALADRMRNERDSLESLGLPVGFGFGVSVPEQRVNIYLPGVSTLQRTVIESYFGGGVAVLDESLQMLGEGEQCGFNACPPPLRGSIRALNVTRNRAASFCCNVRSRVNGAWYILASGHNATAVGQRYSHNGHGVGEVTGTTDSGRNDSARVRIYTTEEDHWDDAAGNPSRWFLGASSEAQAFAYVNRNPLAVVINAAICRSGMTSGHRCGEILQGDANPAFSNNDTMLLTDVCGAEGDSGGPYYTNRNNNGYLAGTIFGMHEDSEQAGCPGGERSVAVHIYYQELYHNVAVCHVRNCALN